jgi:peptidyl-prolyl cis-trans isomerase SurA
LSAGADFTNLAKSVSEDKQSSVNGGDIGFITAMQVVYPFETEAYQTPVGKFSKPVRTLYGYHIIKKLDERAARGEIQVSQIMVGVQKSAGKEGEAIAKARIDSVLVMLKKGEKFESLVEKYSEDKFSKNTQGTLASFGVGQMVPDFEDAAFGLKNPGDMTEPVRTEFGYHIIRLIKRTPVRPFDTIKTELTRKVEKDGRIEIARRLYTEKIKQKVNFKEDVSALEELIAAIPDTNLRNGSFNASDYKRYNKRIFEMTGVTFSQSDFANYIEQYTKGKIYGQKESTLRSLYKNYTDKAIYDFQENKLIDENEEYRNLLTEYRDGIMLFELTDKTVWSKASVDTTGLQQFYEKNKEKYMWQPAIKGVVYKSVDETYAKKLVKELNNPNNKTPDEVSKAVNGDGSQGFVTFESGKYEKSRFPAGTKLVAGKYAPYFKNKDESYTLVDVKEVFDTPTQKTLSEAKGYVVSEYQEYLEKQWLAELENKYPVVVNQETLKAMIR